MVKVDMQIEDVISILENEANPEYKEKLTKFAINPSESFGIRMPVLRKIAKTIGINHGLAFELWNYGNHDTKILATLIDDYTLVTRDQFDRWAYSFTTWDECDQACLNLLYKVDFVDEKIREYSKSDEEFVKRCAFSLIAVLAVHKEVADDYFTDLFPLIIDASDDNRNFVKKAVNWAVRQIGKRNIQLNRKAIELSYRIIDTNTKSGNWIGKNALKELESSKVQEKLKRTK